jgi:hypothetical protein
MCQTGGAAALPRGLSNTGLAFWAKNGENEASANRPDL